MGNWRASKAKQARLYVVMSMESRDILYIYIHTSVSSTHAHVSVLQ